jgi:hypothetical protein
MVTQVRCWQVFDSDKHLNEWYLGSSPSGPDAPRHFCLFVSMGVRGKPRMYCSLLAYCTARFGRSNFDHQVPPRLPMPSAL